MEWYNYFLSSPTVGVAFEATRSEIPILEKLAFSFDNSFSLERPHFSKWILEKRGLILCIELGNISITRRNNINIKHIPGKMPEIEFSDVKKYESVLDNLIDILADVWEKFCSLNNNSNHSAKRIGMVLNTGMTKEELPPGIVNLLDKQNQIWGNNLQDYNFKITRHLKDDDSFFEQCNHSFRGSYSDKGLTELEFDYQFIFKSHKNLTRKQLVSAINDKKTTALSYFSNFGMKGI